MPAPRPAAKFWLILLVAAWLTAAAGGAAYWVLRGPRVAAHVRFETPRQAAESFYKCLGAGHTADVLACVVADSRQQEFAVGLVDAVEAGLDPADLSVIPPFDADAALGADGDLATLTPASPAADRPGELVLRREGGGWRVDLLETGGLTPEQAGAFLARLRAATAPPPGAE